MPLLIAIHGILTSQTDPSWPDKLDAWMYRRDPRVKVLKKEYIAGPFPRWNCWVKDPLLARGLANEVELFLSETGVSPAIPGVSPALVQAQNALDGRRGACPTSPPPWFVAHSNGAVIALLTIKRLIARGCRVGGIIFTGAACEADVEKNRVLEWLSDGVLGTAISYSSQDDEVLCGDPRFTLHGLLAKTASSPRPSPPEEEREKPDKSLESLAHIFSCVKQTGSLRPAPKAFGVHRPAACAMVAGGFLVQIRVWIWEVAVRRLRAWLWGKLMWPYGCLGRTGWLRGGEPFPPASEKGDPQPSRLVTRWYLGGHCTYFKPENIESTFQQIHQDIVRGAEVLRQGDRRDGSHGTDGGALAITDSR